MVGDDGDDIVRNRTNYAKAERITWPREID
jgi:hypothetical protein